MEDIMKIGADELILWLRKNNMSQNIPNMGFNGLGQLINNIIVNQLNGELIAHDVEAYWAHEDDNLNIGNNNLPQTSAQYEIDVDKVSDLYRKISKL
jgi:hypothetical protein